MLKQEIIESYEAQMNGCKDTRQFRSVIIKSLSHSENIVPIEDLTREDLDVIPQPIADDVWNMYQLTMRVKHRKLAQYKIEWIITAIIGKYKGYEDATKYNAPSKKEGKMHFSYKHSKCFTLRDKLLEMINNEADRLGMSYSEFAQRLFCAYFGVKELSNGQIVPVEEGEDYDYFPEPEQREDSGEEDEFEDED